MLEYRVCSTLLWNLARTHTHTHYTRTSVQGAKERGDTAKGAQLTAAAYSSNFQRQLTEATAAYSSRIKNVHTVHSLHMLVLTRCSASGDAPKAWSDENKKATAPKRFME